MDSNKKLFLIGTVVVLLLVGGRVGYIFYQRHADERAASTANDRPKVSDDQLVWLKKKHQDSMKDARELNGKRAWISAGGQMNAYAATASHVDYGKPLGDLLGAEPIDIVNFIEQKADAKNLTRIRSGERQAVMLFTRPADAKTLLGTPVGYLENGIWTFYLDEILFYDDPHTLYKHWSAQQWAAIDAHKVIPGMSELQTQIALGQVSSSAENTMGNRTVQYDHEGHPVRVTFANNHARTIEEVKR